MTMKSYAIVKKWPTLKKIGNKAFFLSKNLVG